MGEEPAWGSQRGGHLLWGRWLCLVKKVAQGGEPARGSRRGGHLLGFSGEVAVRGEEGGSRWEPAGVPSARVTFRGRWLFLVKKVAQGGEPARGSRRGVHLLGFSGEVAVPAEEGGAWVKNQRGVSGGIATFARPGRAATVQHPRPRGWGSRQRSREAKRSMSEFVPDTMIRSWFVTTVLASA